MESFFLAGDSKHQPIKTLELAEGETKILGIQRPKPGDGVSAYCKNAQVAAADHVRRLQDPSKHSLNADRVHPDGSYSYRIPLADVVVGDSLFVQVTGVSSGHTELIARFNTYELKPYAAPLSITVKANPKLLSLGVPFNDLWLHHPYSRNRNAVVCDSGTHNQCMMRFCD